MEKIAELRNSIFIWPLKKQTMTEILIPILQRNVTIFSLIPYFTRSWSICEALHIELFMVWIYLANTIFVLKRIKLTNMNGLHLALLEEAVSVGLLGLDGGFKLVQGLVGGLKFLGDITNVPIVKR